MNGNKLIEILSSFNKKEFQELKKFIESPFFNNKKAIINLYGFLKDVYPDFNLRKYSQEDIFQRILPGQKFNNKRLGNVFSEFYQLTLRYLEISEFNQNKKLRKKCLAKAFSNKGQHQSYQKTIQSLKKEMEIVEYKDMNYYLDLMGVEYEWYFHESTPSRQVPITVLENISKNLDHFFSIIKIRLACEAETKSRIRKERYRLNFLDEANSYLSNNVLTSNRTNNLFYLLYMMVKKDDLEIYEEAKKEFILNLDKLIPSDRIAIHTYFLNFIIRKINEGNNAFVKESFEFYDLGLEKNILTYSGTLPGAVFKNIVFTGLRLGKHDWVERFVKEKKHYLEKDVREKVVIFCTSHILYEKKKFRESRKILIETKFPYLIDNLRSKSLLLRAIFEDFLEDELQYDLLMSQSEAFFKFIKRNKQLKNELEIKRRYLEFSKLVRELGRFKKSKNKSEVKKNKIYNKILMAKGVINKDWLFEKLEMI